MRDELAAFRLEPNPLHQPLVLGLQLHHGLARPERGHDGARLAPAEGFEILHGELECRAPHPPQQRCDLVRDHVVDIADEAQRDVIIFGIGPARARQPAAERGERLRDVGRDFKTGEEARHGKTWDDCRKTWDDCRKTWDDCRKTWDDCRKTWDDCRKTWDDCRKT